MWAPERPSPTGGKGSLRRWGSSRMPLKASACEPERVLDLGDPSACVCSPARSGATSGVSIDASFAHVATFRGSEITHWRACAHREEALRGRGARGPVAAHRPRGGAVRPRGGAGPRRGKRPGGGGADAFEGASWSCPRRHSRLPHLSVAASPASPWSTRLVRARRSPRSPAAAGSPRAPLRRGRSSP
jgi:hypothetical protein